jgi:hypothetical protein
VASEFLVPATGKFRRLSTQTCRSNRPPGLSPGIWPSSRAWVCPPLAGCCLPKFLPCFLSCSTADRFARALVAHPWAACSRFVASTHMAVFPHSPRYALCPSLRPKCAISCLLAHSWVRTPHTTGFGGCLCGRGAEKHCVRGRSDTRRGWCGKPPPQGTHQEGPQPPVWDYGSDAVPGLVTAGELLTRNQKSRRMASPCALS